MTDKQPKALRLADLIERYNAGVHSQAIHEDYAQTAAELRRLHEENQSKHMVAEMYMQEAERLLKINRQLLEALESASNYVDNLGGVSQRYRQVVFRAKEQP